MTVVWQICVYFLLFTCQSANAAVSTEQFALLMPDVQPLSPETYLCTTVKLDDTKTNFIVGFTPNATSHTAHHMLLYGCLTPGRMEPVWDCGEMQGSSSHYRKGQICGSGSQIIYAWAKDAPKLTLPEGIGFKVGGETVIQYLVLQVHYLDVQKFIDGATDDSGVVLTYTETPMPRLAGVYMLGTNGYIPAKSTVHMESACSMDENLVLHPLAFRTHTHALGELVSGYVVTSDGKRRHKWTMLGQKDPQLPQMFYPVDDPSIVIHKGDILAARCTMFNFRNRITRVGSTSEDEMCNFYLLYWVDGNETLQENYCYNWGPPLWYWRDYPLYNIPEDDANNV